MNVLLVGGGSGGHITPLLAVARELKKRHKKAKISYLLEKGSKFEYLPAKAKEINQVYAIRAGKFRRYHGESFWSHLFDVSTNLKNIRDFFYVIIGFFQSLSLLRRLRPDVVFIKGGFVGVPIGLACRWRRVPYFTHDSDTVPGLANRLIAPGALVHAVGMPPEFYGYPKDKMDYTGIPLSDKYKLVTTPAQKKFRKELKLPASATVLTITGGSLGAQRLNESFMQVAESLLLAFPKLHILHQTGSEEPIYGGLRAKLQDRVHEVDFTDNLPAFTGAADVVLSRAGATTVAELAVQGKPCILVPNPQLTGGQQTNNAMYFERHQAAQVVVEEQATNPKEFESIIAGLLDSAGDRRKLSNNIVKLAKPDADKALTAIIEDIVLKQ